MTRPTLRQLEYAVAVADHLHFRKAAEACLVSQPGLSAQVKELERILGVTLFERNRRQVVVTPAGEEVVARAREVLRSVDAMVERAKGAGGPLTGALRLGVIPTVAPYLLPRFLPRLRKEYPDLRLLLTEDRTARLLEELGAGRLDVLLLALPVDTGDHATVTLFAEPFLLVGPVGHPLLRPKRVKGSTLDGEAVLLLEDGHCLRDHALSFCGKAGARADGEIRGTSLGTLVQMAASGLGITLLPEMAVPVEVHPDSGVVARPFAAPVPTREIGLVWRRSSPRREDFRLLGEIVTAAVGRRAASRRARPRR